MKSISIKEELHKNYIRDHGAFKIDCDTTIFNAEELAIINRWGHWFGALYSGELKPFTWKQEHFIAVMQGKEEPFSVEEQAWHKYLGRKQWEAKHRDNIYLHYVPEEDGFYSREMYEAQQKMMFGIINQEHRK